MLRRQPSLFPISYNQVFLVTRGSNPAFAAGRTHSRRAARLDHAVRNPLRERHFRAAGFLGRAGCFGRTASDLDRECAWTSPSRLGLKYTVTEWEPKSRNPI